MKKLIRRSFRPSRIAFAAILCELMVLQNVLQKEVATKLEVSPGAVSLWMRGKRVPHSEAIVRSLAQYLEAGDRTDELLTAAGFGSRSPFTVEVVTMLSSFLQNLRFSDQSKMELSRLVRDLINVFELREIMSEDVLSGERPAFLEMARSLVRMSPNRRSEIIRAMQLLIGSSEQKG